MMRCIDVPVGTRGSVTINVKAIAAVKTDGPEAAVIYLKNDGFVFHVRVSKSVVLRQIEAALKK